MFDNCDHFFNYDDNNIKEFFKMVQQLKEKTHFLKMIMITRDKKNQWSDIMGSFGCYPEVVEISELDSLSAARLLIAVGKHHLSRQLQNEFELKRHPIFSNTSFKKFPNIIMQINFRLQSKSAYDVYWDLKNEYED